MNGEAGKPGEPGEEAKGTEGGKGGAGGEGGAGGTGEPHGSGGEGGIGGAGGKGARGERGPRGPRGEAAVHVWRWRLLTVWVIAFTLIVAYALHAQRNYSDRNRGVIVLLCDRAGILEDIIRGGIAVVAAERADQNVPQATHDADDAFLKQFMADLSQLQRQTRSPGSPCFHE